MLGKKPEGFVRGYGTRYGFIALEPWFYCWVTGVNNVMHSLCAFRPTQTPTSCSVLYSVLFEKRCVYVGEV